MDHKDNLDIPNCDAQKYLDWPWYFYSIPYNK